jgi:hypothetical protein
MIPLGLMFETIAAMLSVRRFDSVQQQEIFAGAFEFGDGMVCKHLITVFNHLLSPSVNGKAMFSVNVDTSGGPQEVNVVTENGMYALIFSSRKPQANPSMRLGGSSTKVGEWCRNIPAGTAGRPGAPICPGSSPMRSASIPEECRAIRK